MILYEIFDAIIFYSSFTVEAEARSLVKTERVFNTPYFREPPSFWGMF
jgi:hypothetical protein